MAGAVTGAVEGITARIPTEGADLLTLSGVGDANLLELQKVCVVRVTLRDEALVIAGSAAAVEKATPVAQRMIDAARRREVLDPDDVVRFAMDTTADPSVGPRLVLPGIRRVVQGKTSGQSTYLQAMFDNDIVVGIGPAGTGKTYLAVAAAVDALVRKRDRKSTRLNSSHT